MLFLNQTNLTLLLESVKAILLFKNKVVLKGHTMINILKVD